MCNGIFKSAERELQFDGLFEALEPPVSFGLFEGGYPEELFNCAGGIVRFELFGLVVFVFDVNITGRAVVVVFVLKIISTIMLE